MNSGPLLVTNSTGVPNCEKIFLHLFIAIENYKFFRVSITINLEKYLLLVKSNALSNVLQSFSRLDLELGG